MELVRSAGGLNDGIDTHTWKSYRTEWDRACRFAWGHSWDSRTRVYDPFARNCYWADIRNDIDTSFDTDYNLDCADFLELMAEQYPQSAGIILFDPPFSNRMSQDKYPSGDTNLYTAADGRLKRCGEAMKQLLAPGGMVLKAGYNSNSPVPGLELKRIHLVSFGGTRNDVIFSHWRNPNRSLSEWI